ncbi:MAG: methyl-accepting chemotaxis protein [Verrucomicrobiota bacterium]
MIAQNNSIKENGSKEDQAEVSPKRISELASIMDDQINKSIKAIGNINLQTKLLATNGQVEAARSGHVGKAFSVIAEEMVGLAGNTSNVAQGLISETKVSISELIEISDRLGTSVKGTRLTDLALNNIDLVDRNLYERTCDVRWWATDSSLVQALTTKEHDDFNYASKRLGVILDAYTVYFDLVLCDINGNVVANGRPGEYQSQSTNQKDREWFQQAIKSSSGNEYGFDSVHRSKLVNDQHVLIYSCSVRENGEANGKVLGALGILFNWDSLAQTIVDNTPLTSAEKSATRVCFVDEDRMVLADTKGGTLRDKIEFKGHFDLLKSKKDFMITKMGSKLVIVGHAKAPGFETYSTGWHSLIIQELDD